jgi:hypothetical protein
MIAAFYARGGWRKQAIDQAAHFAWGFALAWPSAALGAPVWLCVLATQIGALPREVWDQRPINRWRDTALDLSMFAAGGAVRWITI